MKDFLIVLCILVSGCGASITYHGEASIDDEIRPYADKFIEYHLRTRGALPRRLPDIYFGNLPETKTGHVAGRCIASEYAIVIDRSAWDGWRTDLLKAAREFLVFHELGHCLLGRDHTDSNFSLMQAKSGDPANYIDRHNTLIKELFGVPGSTEEFPWDESYYGSPDSEL